MGFMKKPPPSVEYGEKAIDELRAVASNFGCALYESAPHLLLVDIDGEDTDERRALRTRVLDAVRQYYDVTAIDEYVSRNGHGKHLVYKVDPPINDARERLALQAMLGSDPIREVLAMLKRRDWAVPCVLFKPFRAGPLVAEAYPPKTTVDDTPF